MQGFPAGTVTFLFTDVEGSTRLLHEHGEGYGDLLVDHRRKLREVFLRHGGVEVGTEGDAFFLAFPSAREAAAAAGKAQEALGEGPVRVRMGLHTGEAQVLDGTYVGIDVHRAARIAAVAHGGQVLVSQSTRDLLDYGDLRDLGDHRLKDLTRPERLYQLGGGDFPPLRSLNLTNLPVQLTPLVGRDAEVAEVVDLLRSTRLLTLTGPGGTGKTRLASHVAAGVADRFPGGLWFVALAGVEDPKLVEPTIAHVVGASDTLADHLRDKRSLLLLDNFEHVLDAAAGIGTLLQAADGVTIVVTSRAPLRLSAEREYPVPPLADDDAVALFAERARAVRPSFVVGDASAEICRRLDGLPLALELAAVRVKSLTASQILDRLDRRLDLLTGGVRDAPERQRTLRARRREPVARDRRRTVLHARDHARARRGAARAPRRGRSTRPSACGVLPRVRRGRVGRALGARTRNRGRADRAAVRQRGGRDRLVPRPGRERVGAKTGWLASAVLGGARTGRRGPASARQGARSRYLGRRPCSRLGVVRGRQARVHPR